MKIGIYGGTFNPPYVGHLRGAAQAIEVLDLDKLLLIPDRIAPHKQLPENSATPQQRLDMITIAAKSCPKAEVSDLELRHCFTSDVAVPALPSKLWSSCITCIRIKNWCC